MRIRLSLLLALVPFVASARSAPCSSTSQIQTLQLTSSVFHNTRTVRIWLPVDYDQPAHKNDHYPVLYLNDGQNLFDTCTSQSGKEWRADETAAQLIVEKRFRPIIIVGIDNPGLRNRPKEYLPYPDDTLSPP